MPPKTKTTASTSPGTDDQRARDLVLWCRRQGIHITRVRVGDVELDGMADLRRIPSVDPGLTEPASNWREHYGGAALDRLKRERPGDDGAAVVDDEDDD